MKRVLLVCAAIFPLLTCSGIVYTILSLFIAALGASKSQIGLLYTCGALAGAITSPLSGRLADRWGRKPVLLGSMALFAGVFGGFAFVKEYTQLFPIMIAEGTAWGGLGASVNAMIADLVPQQKRGTALGLYNATWNLGWIIGPLAGGVLSDHLGFRTTFLLCVGLISVGIALGAFLLPRGDGGPSGPGDEPSARVPATDTPWWPQGPPSSSAPGR
ncbi:MAG: MFS transporter [Deltaproteobacteria bacterium]|nr:MAG: MFS transporter [Deltaproteobacteria bacterium]